MPSFSTSRHVPFSAAQMFAVVADVERYPQFLPLCTGIRVLSRRPVADSEKQGEDITARMSVGYKAITEAFTTRVVTDPANQRISVSYIDGPFRRLDNRWHFSADAAGSLVHFFIDYEFRSKMLALLVGAKSDYAMRRIEQAFVTRAGQLYAGPDAVRA
jgi:coenzyme Q-binding protein COQ10